MLARGGAGLPVAAEVLVSVSGYIDDFIFDFRKSIENPVEIVAAQGEADAGLRCMNAGRSRRIPEQGDISKEIAVTKYTELVGIVPFNVCLHHAGPAPDENVEAVARITFIDHDAAGRKVFGTEQRLQLGKHLLAEGLEKRDLFEPRKIDLGTRLALVK